MVTRPERDHEQRDDQEGRDVGEVVPFPHSEPAEPDRSGLQESDDGPVVDAELVDDDKPAVPVDPPRQPAPPPWAIGAPTRRPVIAPWMRDRDQRRAAERWVASYIGHASAYHLVRIPIYVLQVLLQAPRGAARLSRRLVGWLTDSETKPLRSSAIHRDAVDEYMKLSREKADRLWWRRLAAAGGLMAAGLVFVALQFAPWWGAPALVAVLAVLLAYAGRPLDRPWIGPAVVVPTAQPLTSEVVVRALGALGIGELNKALGKNPTGARMFPEPISRDGPGWRAVVELPHGVTVTEVVDKREKLASGLRRPLGCVWPEPVSDEHPGRLVLWVGDQDMSKAKQPSWPLARKGTVDLFAPVPFGTDVRGRWVPLTLMFTSMVIGAVPRMGKTFALRELLLIAALDPRVQLHCYDLKGTGDLGPLEPVAHAYGVGDEDDDLDAALANMQALRAELRRRTKVIRNLPRDLCPENKVSPELAGKAALGLFPIVVGVDECQVWFEHPQHGAEFEAICTDLVKRGPAVGIVLILATQRPDAKSLPTGISANAVTRFCLKVMGQTENDMVLGTSRYKQGVRATMFGFEAKGIGYLVGEGTDAQIVRTVFLDGPAAERLAARARAAREATGHITGHAAGDEPQRGPTVDLLDDVRVVFATAERLWNEAIVTGLAQLRPDVYGSWTAAMLSATLRDRYAIETRQVWIDGRNRNGLRAEQVHTALAARHSPAIEAGDDLGDA